MLGQVRHGTDPLDKRKAETEAGSFATWAANYLELGEKAGRWAPRSLEEVKRHLRRACEAFGSRLLKDVDARTVEMWRDRVQDEHGLTEANRALTSVKACLTEAWKRGHLEVNHASKVSSIAGEAPRTRTLSEAEMQALLTALERQPCPFFRVAMLWLIVTGARRSEVLRAKWRDLRLDPPDHAEWTIPKAKNKRPSVRPIPAELVAKVLAFRKAGGEEEK